MYRALYRKWRPLTFQDVVGQTAIVTALRNQIATAHVGHAYLFTGVRGTGKTSCAKIFAKAINCMSPIDGDPCGKCEACRGIENDSILDVVEMDAASNNGVDNIRDLRDETAYTPSACNYKVYIIDEVHMLSASAFNALLKTLEEPPPHVVFILATTEIQKVPATILSRCQRYDFTRIQPSDLAARAKYVAQQEGIALTDGAADLIARLADGAARDTLSILDTCAGVSSEIDEDVVRRMAGVTDRTYLFEISQHIADGDAVSALADLAALRQKSVDLKRLAEELILHYRNLMLASLPNGNRLLSGVSPEEEAQYLATCRTIPQAQSIHAIRTLGNALEKMTRGNDQRIELELALFSLLEPTPTATSAAPAAHAMPVTPAAPAPFARAAAPTPPSAQPAPFAKTTPAPATVAAPVQAPVEIASEPQPEPIPVAVQPEPEAIPVPLAPTPPAHMMESPLAEVPLSDLDAPPMPEDAPPHPEDAPIARSAPLQEIPTAPMNMTDANSGTQSVAPVDIEQQNVVSAIAARKRAPQVAKQSETIAQDSTNNELVPFAVWPAILKELAQKDPMLSSYLKRSSAYLQGRRVLIEGSAVFRNFIRSNKNSQQLIKSLIFEQTGESYAIGPYEPKVTSAATVSAEDSLRALEAKGVPTTIKN